MQELKQRLAVELPHIEAALAVAVENLPQSVRPVVQHVFAAGGKRLRPFLVVLTARLLGYAQQDIYKLAATMEMLHAATLLHDDVLDGAMTRRGAVAAHTLFTVPVTILAGDALLAEANRMVADFDNVHMCRCFSEATVQTAHGEILEIQYAHCLEQSEHIYTEIVRGKTAWLLRASCMLGALCAQADAIALQHMATYGEKLGMAFQMVDDALDFAPESLTGKPSGGDVREGKLTPPVRLYRQWLSDEQRSIFDTAFTKGTYSAEDAARIGEDICRQGFDTQTRHMAGQALQQACDALHALPQGAETVILQQMTDYVQHRQK